jgi:hypothetical protein
VIVRQPAVPTTPATQAAQHQALLREVNERINEIAERFGLTDGFSILCECAAPDCQERIELARAEYEQLRRMPTHFAVLHGHDMPAAERIVRTNDRFVTVEKFATADPGDRLDRTRADVISSPNSSGGGAGTR